MLLFFQIYFTTLVNLEDTATKTACFLLVCVCKTACCQIASLLVISCCWNTFQHLNYLLNCSDRMGFSRKQLVTFPVYMLTVTPPMPFCHQEQLEVKA